MANEITYAELKKRLGIPDLIDRQALMLALKRHGVNTLMNGSTVMDRLKGYNPTSALNGYELCLRDVSEILAGFTTIEAEPVKHGRWEWRGGIPWCSNCGTMPNGYSYDGDVNTTNYCHNCGAKMDLEKEVAAEVMVQPKEG